MRRKQPTNEVKRLPSLGEMSGNEYLEILRKSDQLFNVKFKAVIYAESTNPSPPKVIISTETMGGTVSRGKTLTQGVPEQQMKVPQPRVTEIAETKPTEGQMIAFPENGQGKFIPNFGGSYGIMDRAMRRTAKALKHRLYKENVLGLIQYVTAADNKIDLPINGAKVTAPPWQQQINVGFGKTARVWQIREKAEEVNGEIAVRISASAPVSREEFYEIIHAVEGKGFGPTEHGSFTVTSIEP